MYTLVIVDMQHYFGASHKVSLQKSVKQEIKNAISKKAAIVFVEFIGCGPTLPSLVKLTDNYSRTFLVRKNRDDGGKEVAQFLKRNRLPSRNIRVCGVNTDCCVLATTDSLAQKTKARIRVVSQACNSDWSHEDGLFELKQIKGVRVV